MKDKQKSTNRESLATWKINRASFKLVRQRISHALCLTVRVATTSANLFSKRHSVPLKFTSVLSIKLICCSHDAKLKQQIDEEASSDENLLSARSLVAVGCLPGDWCSFDCLTINYSNKFIRSSADAIKTRRSRKSWWEFIFSQKAETEMCQMNFSRKGLFGTFHKYFDDKYLGRK